MFNEYKQANWDNLCSMYPKSEAFPGIWSIIHNIHFVELPSINDFRADEK